LRAGQALRGLNRPADALTQFRSAFDMEQNITVGVGKRRINEPHNRAGLALAEMLLERGDRQSALDVLQHTDTIVRDSHSKELSEKKKHLQDAVNRAQSGKR
jgi:hypothetical protein